MKTINKNLPISEALKLNKMSSNDDAALREVPAQHPKPLQELEILQPKVPEPERPLLKAQKQMKFLTLHLLATTLN